MGIAVVYRMKVAFIINQSEESLYQERSVLDASVCRADVILHNISFKMHTHGGIISLCIVHVPVSWVKFPRVDNVRKVRLLEDGKYRWSCMI